MKIVSANFRRLYVRNATVLYGRSRTATCFAIAPETNGASKWLDRYTRFFKTI